MYKKMLVLLDGSKLAEVVFTYARELAGRLGLDLELLNVCVPEKADEIAMHEAYIERKARELQEQCEAIRVASGGSSAECVTVKGTVVMGYPAEEILKYAEKNKMDLIMCSTHGFSGEKRWSLGNIANKVVHAAKVPVWVVPSELKEEIIHGLATTRNMVIPLDGSKAAEAVIPHALTVARQRGAETTITLLHVFSHDHYYFTPTDVKKDIEERNEIKKYMEKITKKVGESGIPTKYEILDGEPAEKIIEYVKDHPTQLMAIATQGRSGLNLMVFGSVTENILQLVRKTPMLLVKAVEG